MCLLPDLTLIAALYFCLQILRFLVFLQPNPQQHGFISTQDFNSPHAHGTNIDTDIHKQTHEADIDRKNPILMVVCLLFLSLVCCLQCGINAAFGSPTHAGALRADFDWSTSSSANLTDVVLHEQADARNLVSLLTQTQRHTCTLTQH